MSDDEYESDSGSDSETIINNLTRQISNQTLDSAVVRRNYEKILAENKKLKENINLYEIMSPYAVHLNNLSTICYKVMLPSKFESSVGLADLPNARRYLLSLDKYSINVEALKDSRLKILAFNPSIHLTGLAVTNSLNLIKEVLAPLNFDDWEFRRFNRAPDIGRSMGFRYQDKVMTPADTVSQFYQSWKKNVDESFYSIAAFFNNLMYLGKLLQRTEIVGVMKDNAKIKQLVEFKSQQVDSTKTISNLPVKVSASSVSELIIPSVPPAPPTRFKTTVQSKAAVMGGDKVLAGQVNKDLPKSIGNVLSLKKGQQAVPGILVGAPISSLQSPNDNGITSFIPISTSPTVQGNLSLGPQSVMKDKTLSSIEFPSDNRPSVLNQSSIVSSTQGHPALVPQSRIEDKTLSGIQAPIEGIFLVSTQSSVSSPRSASASLEVQKNLIGIQDSEVLNESLLLKSHLISPTVEESLLSVEDKTLSGIQIPIGGVFLVSTQSSVSSPRSVSASLEIQKSLVGIHDPEALNESLLLKSHLVSPTAEESLISVNRKDLEDFERAKKLTYELQCEKQIAEREISHLSTELSKVKSEFKKFKEAKRNIAETLESDLKGLQEMVSQHVSENLVNQQKLHRVCSKNLELECLNEQYALEISKLNDEINKLKTSTASIKIEYDARILALKARESQEPLIERFALARDYDTRKERLTKLNEDEAALGFLNNFAKKAGLQNFDLFLDHFTLEEVIKQTMAVIDRRKEKQRSEDLKILEDENKELKSQINKLRMFSLDPSIMDSAIQFNRDVLKSIREEVHKPLETAKELTHSLNNLKKSFHNLTQKKKVFSLMESGSLQAPISVQSESIQNSHLPMPTAHTAYLPIELQRQQHVEVNEQFYDEGKLPMAVFFERTQTKPYLSLTHFCPFDHRMQPGEWWLQKSVNMTLRSGRKVNLQQ